MSVDAFATGQSATSTYTAHRPVIAANRHAVSSGHYLASHAAFQILESGGNAVDAGVAAGLVLGVVHSDQVNIAGVAPMMIYLAAEDRVITIDGLGSWPAAASCERFEREFGGVVPEGLLRTVIPAAPGAWITALQRYGTRSFAEVAQYAIRFAREGFIMYPFLADRLQEAEAKYRRWPSNAAIYLPGGRPPRVGERFVQSDLAASLQYMADQETATAGSRVRKLQAARDAFYQGDIASKIVAFHQENGGLLTAADLAGYAPTIEAPLSTRYGDMDVYACNFWCQGPALLQALNILKSFDLKEMGHNSTRYIHHVAEALKLTFADREHYYADPRFIDVPAQTLLSDAYARQRAQLVRADRAWPEMPPCGEIAGTKRCAPSTAIFRARSIPAGYLVRVRGRPLRQRLLGHAQRCVERHDRDSRHRAVSVLARVPVARRCQPSGQPGPGQASAAHAQPRHGHPARQAHPAAGQPRRQQPGAGHAAGAAEHHAVRHGSADGDRSAAFHFL